MNEHPPAHAALAAAFRELGERITQLADSIEHGRRAEFMPPMRLILLSGDAIAAARTLERRLVEVEAIARALAPLGLGRVAEGEEAP